MTIRRATEEDLAALDEMNRAFEAELPRPAYREVDLDAELREVRDYITKHLAVVAEEEGALVGFALAKLETPRICYLNDLYVRPGWRSKRLGRELIAWVVRWGEEQGAEVMTLEVLAANPAARSFYYRLGFVEHSLDLVSPLSALVERLTTADPGASFGSIHVQTDDVDTVVRAAQIYVPRLPGGSRGTVVLPPRNGWTAVYDELCDRDPAMLRRLAQDISNRLGSFVVLVIGLEEDAVVRYILLERGRVVDEYASVPEFHGPLPPGDVVGLAANPTVVSRLTGADPARVRQVARTGTVPTDLPPPAELLASLAAVLGVEGAAYGYVHAGGEPGAIPVRRPAGGPHIPPA